MPDRSRSPRDRLIAWGTSVAVMAVFCALLISRIGGDRLYWLSSSLTLAAILVVASTLVTAVMWFRSLKIHLALGLLLLIAIVLARPISQKDQSEPVVFSMGLIFPIGTLLLIAILVSLMVRIVAKLREQPEL